MLQAPPSFPTADLPADQAQRFYLSILETLPSWCVALDREDRILAINRAMARSLDYDTHTVIGQNYWQQFVPAEERDLEQIQVKPARHTQQTVFYQGTVQTRSGDRRWVEWTVRPEVNPHTHELDWVIWSGVDITDQCQRLDHASLAQEITQAASAATGFEAALAATLQIFGCKTGWVMGEAWLPSHDGRNLECSPAWYEGAPGLDQFRQTSRTMIFAPGESLAGRIWQSRRPEWIGDVSSASPTTFIRHRLAAACGLRSSFGFPVLAGANVLAVLTFYTLDIRDNDAHWAQVLSQALQPVGSVFQQKRIEERYRKLFANAVEGIFQMTPDGMFLEANPALARLLGYGSPSELIVDLSQRRGIPYLCDDRHREFLHLLEAHDYVRGFECQVVRSDGRQIWVSQDARVVRNQEGKLLYIEGCMLDITSRKWTETQLRYNSSHDALTGLWNRSWFMEQLVQAVAAHHKDARMQFSVLFLDIDGFQRINESLGHGVGDRLLIALAGRLENSLPPHAQLARLGGDEFTVLVERGDSVMAVSEIAQGMLDALKRPFSFDDRELFLQASIGIAYTRPPVTPPPASALRSDAGQPASNSQQEALHQAILAADQTPPATWGPSHALPLCSQNILRDADLALRRAKTEARGSFVLFDAAMQSDTLQQLQLETDLRWAIERQEFCLAFQPIIELGSNDLVGFEALIRWEHPRHGRVYPDKFIGLAEERGWIVEIGAWVLEEACRQLMVWRQHYPQFPALSVNVNLSARQMTPDFEAQLDRVLATTGISPEHLKLEITESLLIDRVAAGRSLLERLRDRGIRICLDDFGTGYSALSYLHQFPIDVLKIDRSFVPGNWNVDTDGAILQTIVDLARALKLAVVVEGIETPAQLERLREMGCEYGQGYLFARPLDPAAVTQMLAEMHLGMLSHERGGLSYAWGDGPGQWARSTGWVNGAVNGVSGEWSG
jgi:diguanylate cyclase (GGDEF)-like protein/PAS domain S-box-containing protein